MLIMKNISHNHIPAIIIMFVIIICSNSSAQIIEESWAPVSFHGNLVYVDLKNIDSFQADDIYVWTIENLKSPLEMEDVDKDIYRTKTYYLINKKIKRYSLVEILYYDEDNNVIKDFNYEVSTDDPELRYSYPILDGSLVDLVLQRCEREIESKRK